MISRMPHKSFLGNTGSPTNMFFASVLLHLIVIAAILITVPGASRQLTFGAPYSVALVGADVMQASPKASLSKSILPPSTSAPSVILKRNATSTAATPVIKKEETAASEIAKAISVIEQKELSRTDTKTANKHPSVSSPPGVSGSPSDSQSQITDYGRLVWATIKKNWSLPPALMPKNNVETIIDVRITPSGALEYIGFEKRSGNHYFDESALRAVKKSAPFPPFQGGGASRSIEIGIRFHSAELR